MKTNTESSQRRWRRGNTGWRMAICATVGCLCPALMGQGTLGVISATNEVGGPGIVTQFPLSFGDWGHSHAIGIVVGTNDVGCVFPITQAQDTNFERLVALLTNGIPDWLECDFWTGGTASTESHLFSSLGGNRIDFQGLYIDNIAFQIDSLSLDLSSGSTKVIVSYRIFVNSAPVAGCAPSIIGQPATQTAEVGTSVSFSVRVANAGPLSCQWFFNGTNVLSRSPNCNLQLTNVQVSQSGAYSVAVTRNYGTVTSAPAMLQVIAPVERRAVPRVQVSGQTGTVISLDYANSLGPLPTWTTLGALTIIDTPQYWYDPTRPVPSQRFYRTRQTPPSSAPSLILRLVPAITLAGSVGDRFRLDYINQFGPLDAWVVLDTISLTNTSQLYFDASSLDQPPRLYRVVRVP